MSELHKRQRAVETRSRALVLTLHRQALADTGDRIKASQDQLDAEVERVGIQIAGALGAGMRISEIAELTGLSRQKVYELRDRHRGVLDDLDMRVLTQLGAAGALTSAQVSAHLGVDGETVAGVIADLEARELARPLVSEYLGGQSETHFKITAVGAEALERWMLEPSREPTRMSVYVAISPGEKEALRDVAIEVFGPEWFAIIEPGTMHGQTAPELAFHVVAETTEEAVARARERVDQLRNLAGVSQQPVVITTLMPAGPLHLTFGHRRSWLTDGIGQG